MLIGFKRLLVQPFNNDGTPKGDLIVIEGTQDKGATQEANITGLSADPVKTYGSNVAYYVSQKGPGDVSVEFKLLDVPSEAEDRILGYETDDELNVQFLGEDTEPPYCAAIAESSDAQGNVALFGFFKGKFNKKDIKLKTKEGGNYEPESDVYTYSAVASDQAGKSKDKTMAKFLGKETDAEKVKELILRSTGA